MEDMTIYDEPGTYMQAVSAGERWYFTIDYSDDRGNSFRDVVGPFISDGSG